MTLLIDPPLLVAVGAAIERLVEDHRLRRRLEAAVTVATMAAGVAFYVNAPWTRPFWPLLRIESGRDWMLNSWVLHFDHRTTSPALHLAVTAAFAAYPAWMAIGRRIGAASEVTDNTRDSPLS